MQNCFIEKVLDLVNVGMREGQRKFEEEMRKEESKKKES